MAIDFSSTVTQLKSKLDSSISANTDPSQLIYLAKALEVAVGSGGINDIATAVANALTALSAQQTNSVSAVTTQQATSVAAINAAAAAMLTQQYAVKGRQVAKLQDRNSARACISSFTTFIMGDGSLRAVGGYNYGANGDPAGQTRNVPASVLFETNTLGAAGANLAPVLPFVKTVHSASAAFALDSAGRVWSWGYNGQGVLGHGDNVNRFKAKLISYFVTNNLTITDIYAPNGGSSNLYDFVAFKTSTNLLYTCGYNGVGQIGDGTTTNRSLPTLVTGVSNVDFAFVSGENGNVVSVYVKTIAGALYSWGYNRTGQLGLGHTTTPITSPQLAVASGVSKVHGAVGFANADNQYGYSALVKTDGTVWATGYNSDGQLGLGDTVNRSAYVQVSGIANATNVFCSGGVWGSTFLLRNPAAPEIWATGRNTFGQLGSGNNVGSTIFVKPVFAGQGAISDFLVVGGGTATDNYVGWAALDTATGVPRLWACGCNHNAAPNYGNLGLGSLSDTNIPLLVPLPIFGQDALSTPVTIAEIGPSCGAYDQGSFHIRLNDGRVLASGGANGNNFAGLPTPVTTVSNDGFQFILFP